MIHHGDCLEVMAGMEPESVDAIVTDPPYDLTNRTPDVKACEACGRVLGGTDGKPASCPRCGGPLSYQRSVQGRGFMGKVWDGTGIAFRPETWEAAYRVAKPSAYLLAFGGTRTVHRMTVAIEDAGWIIRDMLVWCFASGFPKSKASLKPAWEPIVMARKPGPLRMLAIDACRIGFASDDERAEVNARTGPNSRHREQVGGGVTGSMTKLGERHVDDVTHPAGRWPANVILTDPVFDGGWDGVVGGGEAGGSYPHVYNNAGAGLFPIAGQIEGGYGDSGTYSRFFLIPKADRADREPMLGLTTETRRTATGKPGMAGGNPESSRPGRRNVHPTVKPTDLMRHLVRLVTPTGGTVLDPFLGSGTTGLAAEMEGFDWIGIEREAEYIAIAEARLNGTQRGLGLVG